MILSRWIVAVEWTVPVPPPIAEWKWIHDYRALLGPVDQAIPTHLQTVFLVDARKISRAGL